MTNSLRNVPNGCQDNHTKVRKIFELGVFRGNSNFSGLSFSCQQLDEVPLEPHDEMIDSIIIGGDEAKIIGPNPCEFIQ